ncbi:hypothetical protein QQ045_009529 [Rhodiola kirilowii]
MALIQISKKPANIRISVTCHCIFSTIEDNEMNYLPNTTTSIWKIFKANVELIESSNAIANRPYKLSLNKFADQTNDEFRISRNGLNKKNHKAYTFLTVKSPFRYENVTDVPSAVDYIGDRKGLSLRSKTKANAVAVGLSQL